MSLEKEVESRLKDGKSEDSIRKELIELGYLDEDIESALIRLEPAFGALYFKHKEDTAKDISLLRKKMLLDRIGYGFAGTQFVNILFWMTGAPLVTIGLVNMAKTALSTLYSSVLEQYSRKRSLSKHLMSTSGLIYGFSFLFMALAVSIQSIPLFAASLIIGGIGAVTYGDLFKNYAYKALKKDRLIVFLPGFTFFGVLLTTFSLFLSAFIMDLIPLSGRVFELELFGTTQVFRLFGFLLSFEITAFAFILSAYMLAHMKTEIEREKKRFVFRDQVSDLIEKAKKFLLNRYLLILALSAIVLSAFNSIINSFIGIHLFGIYKDAWLGGFLNIAIIFGFALLASFFGPGLASRLNKNLGLAPMLVFGIMLMAILPLTVSLYEMPFLPAIVAANICSVLGASILATSQSILIGRLLNDREKDEYYSMEGFVTLIPYVIIVVCALVVMNTIGLAQLFRTLGFGLIVLLVPMYLLLVIWTSRKHAI